MTPLRSMSLKSEQSALDALSEPKIDYAISGKAFGLDQEADGREPTPSRRYEIQRWQQNLGLSTGDLILGWSDRAFPRHRLSWSIGTFRRRSD
jgi:hypothetical protein